MALVKHHNFVNGFKADWMGVGLVVSLFFITLRNLTMDYIHWTLGLNLGKLF